MVGNPWVDRFPVDWSDNVLDRAIATSAGALPNLDELPLHAAYQALQIAFAELTVPSCQMRATLRRLLNRARAGAQQLFPDQRAFQARAYAKDPTPCSLPMTCITSLAGCGKTALIRALMRALPAPTYLDVPGHSRFRLVAGYSLTASAGISLRQILEPVFPDGAPVSSFYSLARRQLAKDGAASIFGDELQFVTQSLDATRVTNLLLQLGNLGPPAGYVTNFSLIHRLIRRPKELRDRLLADPLILLPEEADSDDWLALLHAHLAIHPAFAVLAELRDLEIEMHLRTYGLKRNVPKLLALAYCVAREDGSSTVHLRHLERAYLSLAYASSRIDVEVLLKSRVTGFGKREDLWCPLDGVDIFAPALKAISWPDDSYAQKLAQAALVSSMTTDETKHLNSIAKGRGTPAKPERPVRPKVTAAALAAGALAMKNKFKRGSGGGAAA